jgi:hypothetical protein
MSVTLNASTRRRAARHRVFTTDWMIRIGRHEGHEHCLREEREYLSRDCTDDRAPEKCNGVLSARVIERVRP